MREILFRGKRKDNGEWVIGNLFIPDKADTPTQICIGTNIIRITFDILPETIGQYTGLTDKNGTKIFEGDILLSTVQEYERGLIPVGPWQISKRATGKKTKAVWTVEYKEHRSRGNGFYVYGKDRRFNATLNKNIIFNTDPEIIGNIYDNPELLEKGE